MFQTELETTCNNYSQDFNFYNDIFLQPIDQQYFSKNSNENFKQSRRDLFDLEDADLNSTMDIDLESSINSCKHLNHLLQSKNSTNSNPSTKSLVSIRDMLKTSPKNSIFKQNKSKSIKITQMLSENLSRKSFEIKITKQYLSEFLKLKLINEINEKSNYELNLIKSLSKKLKL